jgi:hypothetical protein
MQKQSLQQQNDRASALVGKRVNIKKGALIKSMNPERNNRPCGRKIQATIEYEITGCIRRGRGMTKPSVAWTGSKGYTCWTEVGNVL